MINKCYERKGASKVQGENGPIIPTFRTAEVRGSRLKPDSATFGSSRPTQPAQNKQNNNSKRGVL